MKQRKASHFWIPASLIIVDSLLFGLSDPDKVPSYMLIVAFLLVTTTLYYLLRSLILALSWYGIKLAHPKRLAWVITLVGGGLIALQSIGELTGRDILVMLPFVVVGYLYVSYGRNPSRSVKSN